MTRDPYEVLGLSRDATPDEIKSAFRKLARQHHPDVNPNNPESEEKFKELGNAYGILSDPDRKAQFDRFGTTDEQSGGMDFTSGGFGDLFDMFFGQSGGGGRRGQDGGDIRVEANLTLADVISGKQLEVKFRRNRICDECGGKGTQGGVQPERCSTCNGQGSVSRVANTILGQMRTSSPCPTCGGSGTIIRNPCPKCRGRKLISEDATETLGIPGGIESGQTMHLPGKGHAGIDGGRAGDLYAVIDVKEDPRFVRQDQTLFTHAHISFAQATLGDEINVEGIDEQFDLTIPSGTQPGTELRIRQAGLPPLRGTRRGDLVVVVQVVVPTSLNSEQEEAVRRLAESLNENPLKVHHGSILGGLFGKK